MSRTRDSLPTCQRPDSLEQKLEPRTVKGDIGGIRIARDDSVDLCSASRERHARSLPDETNRLG